MRVPSRPSPPQDPLGAEYEFHLFREVNDHLRATEQKHLQVSIGFISATALALSFLVPAGARDQDWGPVLHSWPRAMAYFALILAGCATMFAQHVYRGWKKDYILAAKKLVHAWPVADRSRVNWMRVDRGPYSHPDRAYFRLAGDNALFWFVLIITSAIVVFFLISLTKLVERLWLAALLVAAGAIIYALIVGYITTGGVKRKEYLEKEWEEFLARHVT